MPGESLFRLKETNYYPFFVFGVVFNNFFNPGIMGLVTLSLLASIMVLLVLPLSDVLVVIFLQQKFDG